MLSVFSSFYRYKKQLLLMNEAGLSHLLMDVLKEYFDTYRGSVRGRMMKNLEKQVEQGGVSYPERMREYHLAFEIGGIYASLLLWFSHGMEETPEEMTRIAMSFCL